MSIDNYVIRRAGSLQHPSNLRYDGYKASNEAGGMYLFSNHEAAQTYLEMHTERLRSFGISPVNGKIFAVNEPLSLIDRAKR